MAMLKTEKNLFLDCLGNKTGIYNSKTLQEIECKAYNNGESSYLVAVHAFMNFLIVAYSDGIIYVTSEDDPNFKVQ